MQQPTPLFFDLIGVSIKYFRTLFRFFDTPISPKGSISFLATNRFYGHSSKKLMTSFMDNLIFFELFGADKTLQMELLSLLLPKQCASTHKSGKCILQSVHNVATTY